MGNPNAVLSDEEFWNSSEFWKQLKAFAETRTLNPWGLAMVVLTRVSFVVPADVVIDGGLFPEDKSFAPLSLMTVCPGESGNGKGLLWSAAKRIIPDVRGGFEASAATSGEGIMAMFSVTAYEQTEDGKVDRTQPPYQKFITSRAVINIDEISALAGGAARQGSTIIPTLLSAWSGAALGSQNKDVEKRQSVPAMAYRLCSYVGAQPAAGALFQSGSDLGFTQRFLFAPPLPESLPESMPTEMPPMPTFDSSKLPADAPKEDWETWYKLGIAIEPRVIHLPNEFRESFWTRRRMVMNDPKADPLGAHENLLRARVAALLQLMENNSFTVTSHTWALAGVIIRHSNQTRAAFLAAAREAVRNAKAEQIADDAAARIKSEELSQRAKIERVKNTILRFLERKDPGFEGLSGQIIRKNALRSTDRDAFIEAITQLFQAGEVDRLGSAERDAATDCVWALSLKM